MTAVLSLITLLVQAMQASLTSNLLLERSIDYASSTQELKVFKCSRLTVTTWVSLQMTLSQLFHITQKVLLWFVRLWSLLTESVVTLGVGQRVDVIVQAPASPAAGGYLMRSSIAACSLFEVQHATAVVYYGAAVPATVPTTTVWPDFTNALANQCGNVCKPISKGFMHR